MQLAEIKPIDVLRLLAFFHHAYPPPSSIPSMHHLDLQFIPHRGGERQENPQRWKTCRA